MGGVKTKPSRRCSGDNLFAKFPLDMLRLFADLLQDKELGALAGSCSYLAKHFADELTARVNRIPAAIFPSPYGQWAEMEGFNNLGTRFMIYCDPDDGEETNEGMRPMNAQEKSQFVRKYPPTSNIPSYFIVLAGIADESVFVMRKLLDPNADTTGHNIYSYEGGNDITISLIVLWDGEPVKLVFYHLPHGTDETHRFARMQVQLNSQRIKGYILLFTQKYKGIKFPWEKHEMTVTRVTDVYVPEIVATKAGQPIALCSIPPWYSNAYWGREADKQAMIDKYEEARAVNDEIGRQIVQRFSLCGYQNISSTDVSTMYAAVVLITRAILGEVNAKKSPEIKPKKKGGKKALFSFD